MTKTAVAQYQAHHHVAHSMEDVETARIRSDQGQNLKCQKLEGVWCMKT